MWQTEGYDKLPYQRPVNEETIKEVTERLPKVLDLMTRSENSYLSQSAEFLLYLYASGQISFSIETEPITTPYKTAIATLPIIEQNKLHYLILIDADEMINNSNNMLLALQLGHEGEHIKNSINITDQLPPSFTLEQKLKSERERKDNIDTFIDEEARAWAWESRTYIYQYGLGFRGIVQTNIHQHAAAFIRITNGNPIDHDWKRYVAHEIFGIKNWQPKKN